MATIKYQITEPRKNVGIYEGDREDRRPTTDNIFDNKICSLQYNYIMKNLWLIYRS